MRLSNLKISSRIYAMRHGTAAIATLFLLAAPAIANDNSAWSAMTKIGMSGTWAPTCSVPASPSNAKLTYYRGANNHVLRNLDRGPGAASLNVSIDGAHLVSSTEIAVRIRNDDPNWQASNGVAFDVVIGIVNNKMHTIRSVGTDGIQYIKDGIVVKQGTPAASLEKCSN